MSTTRQTCPRRVLEEGPQDRNRDLDRWENRPDSTGLTCSYCGSLHPDKFFELVEAGWVVEPTDKSYKVYIARRATRSEVEKSKAIFATAPDAHDMWQRQFGGYAQTAGRVSKFYMQHLTDEQQHRFVDLYNAGLAPRQVEIDLNARDKRSNVPVRTWRIDGNPPAIGDKVVVFESEDRVSADAEVAEVTDEFTYIKVDWDSMRDGVTPHMVMGYPGRFYVKPFFVG